MKRSELQRNHIKPTNAQIKSNLIVVPRYFINENNTALRWSQTFDVEVNGRRFASRHLDSENRIGGIALNGNVESGSILQMTIDDNLLKLTTVASRLSDAT